jgi:hypothetical protein
MYVDRSARCRQTLHTPFQYRHFPTEGVSQQILINQRALFFPQKRAETVLCNRNSWSAVSRRRSIFDLSLSVDTRRRKARTEVTVWTDELTVTVLCSAVSERLNREAAGPAYSIGGSRVWPLKRHKTPRVRHPPCPPWPPCDVFSSVLFALRRRRTVSVCSVPGACKAGRFAYLAQLCLVRILF